MEVSRQEAAATLREVATHQEEAVTLQEVVTAQVDQDISKLELDTNRLKANISTHNCCTKSRKSCCNKKTWAAAAADMEVTHQEVDMEAADMEFHLLMAHLKSHLNMAHQATAQDVLLELNSVMPFRDTKLLNT